MFINLWVKSLNSHVYQFMRKIMKYSSTEEDLKSHSIKYSRNLLLHSWHRTMLHSFVWAWKFMKSKNYFCGIFWWPNFSNAFLIRLGMFYITLSFRSYNHLDMAWFFILLRAYIISLKSKTINILKFEVGCFYTYIVQSI